MNASRFAVVAGFIYLVIGIAGFVPWLLAAPPLGAPDLAVQTLHGRLLGLFPVNLLHNLVHIAIGIWGLAAARRLGSSILFARGLAILYGLLALMGLIPVLNTMFGLVPLYSHDIWLHAGTALIAVYFGWFARRA